MLWPSQIYINSKYFLSQVDYIYIVNYFDWRFTTMKANKESIVQMDFVEKVTLSPFEKYVRFNRFPWKFVLHLLLIMLTTYQALKIVEIQDKHTRIQEAVFSTIYLQDGDGSSTFPYYSLSDFA